MFWHPAMPRCADLGREELGHGRVLDEGQPRALLPRRLVDEEPGRADLRPGLDRFI